jgi:cyclopropane-fatty-acyl-phospholipid synthase
VGHLAIQWVERGWLPDWLIRLGIRALLKRRLRAIGSDSAELFCDAKQAFMTRQNEAPIALQTEAANQQHYELPAEFFSTVLGPHLKYSCGFWRDTDATLEQSERHGLEDTCRFAQLGDSQKILELGCGWGSLTLWMAQHYPHSTITAVSNSRSQAQHIRAKVESLGFANVEVITCDMNDFDTASGQFDRIVSVEMFEHMRNYGRLYAKINRWLAPGGLFFKHIFAHRNTPYEFVVEDASDWMSTYFFTGGMMPSDDLPAHFQQHLKLIDRQIWDGRHYQKTSNAWLVQMDTQKDRLMPLMREVYGADQAATWWLRWRLFFMACAELFGYRQGQEWWVGHYLFIQGETG